MSNPLYETLFAPHTENNNAFIHDPLSKATIRYSDFIARSTKLAATFQDLGLNAGDRLAVQIGKSPEALMIYAACVQAGIVFLPLNTAYTANEVNYFIEDSGTSLLVCDPNRHDELTPLANTNQIKLFTLSSDGVAGSLIDAVSSCNTDFTPVTRNLNDLAALLYTSGTTGRSKGAMLTQNNLISNTKALAALWQFSEEDILLHALPVFHTHGLIVATNVTLFSKASFKYERCF